MFRSSFCLIFSIFHLSFLIAFEECPVFRNFDTLAELIIQSRQEESLTQVEVLKYHVVCSSKDLDNVTETSVSLVIAYRCSGNASCRTVQNNTITFEEQFDFGCTSDSSYIWYGRNQSGFLANFTTPLRQDCSACIGEYGEQYATQLNTSIDISSLDPVSHCLRKIARTKN